MLCEDGYVMKIVESKETCIESGILEDNLSLTISVVEYDDYTTIEV